MRGLGVEWVPEIDTPQLWLPGLSPPHPQPSHLCVQSRRIVPYQHHSWPLCIPRPLLCERERCFLSGLSLGPHLCFNAQALQFTSHSAMAILTPYSSFLPCAGHQSSCPPITSQSLFSHKCLFSSLTLANQVTNFAPFAPNHECSLGLGPRGAGKTV